jgi:acyl-CoA thioester hydrolase
MTAKTFTYSVLIKEAYLDAFGHMNNATYLTLFEEARWDLMTKNNYGLAEIMKTGLGPTILETHIRYLKELKLRDEIIIETHFSAYSKKIGKLSQKMLRNGESCCTAEFSFGLFDLKKRKLVLPTPAWLKVME